MKMRFSIIALISIIRRENFCSSFTTHLQHTAISETARNDFSLYTTDTEEDCEGYCPEVIPGLEGVTATKLRQVQLSDLNGKSRILGSEIGSNKSIVIFLRHLA